MTDTVDRLLTRHYNAYVLKHGDLNDVLNDLQAAAVDPDIKQELQARKSAIDAIGLGDTDLHNRCFSAYIELLALRKTLPQENTNA